MIKSFIIRYLHPFMLVFYRYIVIDSLLWSNATQDSRVQQRDKLTTFFVKSRYTLHCLRQNYKLILFYFVYSNCAFSWTIFDIIKMLALSNYVKYLLIYNYVYIYVFLCVWGGMCTCICAIQKTVLDSLQLVLLSHWAWVLGTNRVQCLNSILA